MLYYEIRKKKLGELIAKTSLSAFAEKTGRSKSLYSDILNGRKTIGERLARSIEEAAGLPPGYLDTADIGVDLDVSPQRRIPLITWDKIAVSGSVSEGEEALLTDMCDVSENAYALTITDDSMVPVFSRGDKIIVDPDVRPVPGDYVVASTPSGFVFRKYRLLEEGFSLRPLNEDYPPIAGDKARVVAVMLEHRVYRKVAT